MLNLAVLKHIISIWFKTTQYKNNMPEGRACWAGLLWVRDTAGNMTSMGNFLSKQLSLFRLAHKITEQWGVKNSYVWQCKRNFHIACVFHKLSHSAFLPGRTKAAQNLLLLQSAGAAGKKTDRLSGSVSPQVENKFIIPSPTRPSIRQGTARGLYQTGVPPPLKGFLEAHFHIWSTPVNQSTHWAPFVYRIPLFINTGEQEITFNLQIGMRQIIILLCFQTFELVK